MKAVILVGGEATRLRPLTCNIPKTMVPVLNTPFLEHVIAHLKEHRIKDIILAQGLRQQEIENHFEDGDRLGVRLIYVIEDQPLGTGGAIKNAAKHLDETFLVLNGDIFTDLDITAMIALHRNKKAKITIAGTRVNDPTSYGLIETDAGGRITRFLEKPKSDEITTDLINAGTYVMEPEVLNYITPQTMVSIERETFPQLLDEGEPLYAYDSAAYWIDIGTPEKYLQLHRDLLCGKSRRYGLAPGEEGRIEGQSHIHPTARIRGPAVIGPGCDISQRVELIGPVAIGPGCTIGEDAVIEESVIWQNVQIGPRANLKNSIIGHNCCFNADCTAKGSVISDGITVPDGSKLEPGSKIWPEGTEPPET